MNEKDKSEIAALAAEIAAKIIKEQEKTHVCPIGLDPSSVESIKNLANASNLGKKTAYKAIIILLVGAIASALYAGIQELIHK